MGLLDTEKYLRQRATAGDPHGVKLRQSVREADDAQCSLCRLLEDEERARLHWLAYQGLADAGLRRRLKESRGFCPRHVRLLTAVVADETRNLSAIAQVMRELSAADAEVLAGARLGRGRRGRASVGRLLAALQPTAACPACEAAAEAAARKTATFAAALAEPAFRELYTQSAGALCRPHLLAVLARVADHDAAGALVEKHAAGLQRDIEDLDELLRKTDYRSAAEPKGAEQQSPLRSVLRFIGTWPQ